MALFTVGSLLCGLAWNNSSLIVFRVIQGLGGGMMSPLGMTMLFKAVAPSERNAVMGIYGLPIIFAPVLGPTIGGYLVEYVDWRAIFTLNVPIGIVGIVLGLLFLRESELNPGLRFDVRGFFLSAIAFSALLLALSDANTDGWTSPTILIRFGIGIVSLIAWILVELTDPEPLLELRLFKDRVFTMAMIVSFILVLGLFGGQLLVPLFLQSFRGLGAAETGMITMFQALPMLVMMPLIGRNMDRIGMRRVLFVGLPLVAITTWLFASLDLTTSDNALRLLLALRGAAMGLVMMPAFTAAMNAAPMHLMSRASSLTNVSRQIFGSFGTAIFVYILSSRTDYHTAMLRQTVTPENLPLQQMLANTQQMLVAHGASLAQAQAAAMAMLGRFLGLSAATMAFDDVFRVAAVITLFALIPAAFLGTPTRQGGSRSGPAIME
jgi:DHA2 family multidrug resistance protein